MTFPPNGCSGPGIGNGARVFLGDDSRKKRKITMVQNELFPDERYTPARQTDPVTSKVAAEELYSSGRGNSARMQMYFAFKVAPMTANEAAQYCVNQLGGMHETYRKRCKELERSGYIRPLPAPRRCNQTGKQAQVYEVV